MTARLSEPEGGLEDAADARLGHLLVVVYEHATNPLNKIKMNIGAEGIRYYGSTAEFFDDDGDTVGGDYVSGNKTLGDYWASKNLWVDRAYVAYTPNWADGVTALFGKMGNPFYKVGKNQLIWDGDLNPEGIAVQYEKGDLFVNGMFGLVQENGSSSDKQMLGVQAGLVHAFADDSKLTYGAGYFDYLNVQGEEAIVKNAFAGNTANDNGTPGDDTDDFVPKTSS